MPLIVHILGEDLELWEPAARSIRSWHYRPRLGLEMSQELAEQIQLIAPAPLNDLVGRDMDCYVNIEKGWMSRKIGAHPEVKFHLKMPVPKDNPRDRRRLRLRIKSIDASSQPPKVILESLRPEEFKR
jgi:hypothetical protein